MTDQICKCVGSLSAQLFNRIAGLVYSSLLTDGGVFIFIFNYAKHRSSYRICKLRQKEYVTGCV